MRTAGFVLVAFPRDCSVTDTGRRRGSALGPRPWGTAPVPEQISSAPVLYHSSHQRAGLRVTRQHLGNGSNVLAGLVGRASGSSNDRPQRNGEHGACVNANQHRFDSYSNHRIFCVRCRIVGEAFEYGGSHSRGRSEYTVDAFAGYKKVQRIGANKLRNTSQKFCCDRRHNFGGISFPIEVACTIVNS